MARFAGTGKITLKGSDARIYDCHCDNSGGVELDGNQQIMSGRFVTGEVVVAANRQRIRIENNILWPQVGNPTALTLMGRNHDSVIVGNIITDNVGGG